MKSLFLTTCLLFGLSAQAAPKPAFLDSYLEIQVTLAKDTAQGVNESAKGLIQGLKKEGQKKVAEAATPLLTDKTLESCRNTFQKVSDLLLPWMRTHKIKGIILAYCPMKKAYWLQGKGDLRNPYYGTEMLECGVEEEVK